jgi:hypothetical protein
LEKWFWYFSNVKNKVRANCCKTGKKPGPDFSLKPASKNFIIKVEDHHYGNQS